MSISHTAAPVPPQRTTLTCIQAQAFHRPMLGSERKIAWVVALTVTMMVIEILAGWQFHSMALLADGWHMSTHALALGISLLAYALSRRFAGDHRFAFGTWKIEILGAYTSALILAAVACSMLWESSLRLFNPGTIHYGESMLVAMVGLAVNLLSAWLLGDQGHSHGPGHHHGHGHSGHSHAHAQRDHDHDHHDHHEHHEYHEHHEHDHDHDHDHDDQQHGHQDLNKKAAYIHVLTDAATSVLAIVALAGGMLWGAAWLDPVMGLVGGVVILYWAKGLLSETTRILIDAESHGPVSEQIRDTVTSHHSSLLDLHVWRIGETRYAAIVGLPAVTEPQLNHLRHHLEQIPNLAHLTLETHPH